MILSKNQKDLKPEKKEIDNKESEGQNDETSMNSISLDMSQEDLNDFSLEEAITK